MKCPQSTLNRETSRDCKRTRSPHPASIALPVTHPRCPGAPSTPRWAECKRAEERPAVPGRTPGQHGLVRCQDAGLHAHECERSRPQVVWLRDLPPTDRAPHPNLKRLAKPSAPRLRPGQRAVPHLSSWGPPHPHPAEMLGEEGHRPGRAWRGAGQELSWRKMKDVFLHSALEAQVNKSLLSYNPGPKREGDSRVTFQLPTPSCHGWREQRSHGAVSTPQGVGRS